MERDDVRKLLTLIQAEYPHSFAKLDERQMALKMELWEREFAEDDSRIVFTAARLLMRDEREFAPTSGQIREKIQSLLEPEYLDEQQAWALVSEACRGSSKGYQYLFDKLPEEVREAVGSPNQLMDWGLMDVETVQSVVASNFMRTYRAKIFRKREMAKIPENIRAVISGISGSLQLKEGEV